MLARLLVVCALLCPAVAEAVKDAYLVSHGGYGTTDVIVVRGRVGRGEPVAAKDRSKAGKAWATTRSFFGRDVEHPKMRIRDLGGAASAELKGDDDGFFEARLPGPFPGGPREVEVALVEKNWRAEPLRLRVDVVDGKSGYVVVTDIDDTIIETGVTGSKLDLVKRIATSDEKDIKAFAGAAEALTAFAAAGVPIVYVSASPVEIGPRLMRFLAMRQFPAGTLFLRHYEEDGIGNPTAYKRKRIDSLLVDFPGRKLVLFGDNGEKDRDIFDALARDTGRVAHSYIRRTLPDERKLTNQLLFVEWTEVVPHARGLGMVK